MDIRPCTNADISTILAIYKAATELQVEKFKIGWPEFSEELVRHEIACGRQWKMVVDGRIGCVWTTYLSDRDIWEDVDSDDAVYLHRIATAPHYRHNNATAKVVAWAKGFAGTKNRRYLRMDTVGNNIELIAYYKKCGFRFLGFSKIKDAGKLPLHYHNAWVALFEIDLSGNLRDYSTKFIPFLP